MARSRQTWVLALDSFFIFLFLHYRPWSMDGVTHIQDRSFLPSQVSLETPSGCVCLLGHYPSSPTDREAQSSHKLSDLKAVHVWFKSDSRISLTVYPLNLLSLPSKPSHHDESTPSRIISKLLTKQDNSNF